MYSMRILVVDDEGPIRECMSEILTRAGHKVDLAADGDEAIRIYDERGPYDVVLTDILHPGPNGLELMKIIHKKYDRQKVALVAGFPMLEKPFRAEQLLQFVERFKP